MSLKVCLDCATAYAADLLKCPHCGFLKSRWDHEEPPAPPKTKKDPGKDD